MQYMTYQGRLLTALYDLIEGWEPKTPGAQLCQRAFELAEEFEVDLDELKGEFRLVHRAAVMVWKRYQECKPGSVNPNPAMVREVVNEFQVDHRLTQEVANKLFRAYGVFKS